MPTIAQKKLFAAITAGLVLGGAVLLAGSIALASHLSASWLPPFDRSIKTAYGVPIMVRRAIDGDTIELINGDRVRYIGIDTPEEVDPQKPMQCFAREAATRNKELVQGKMITLYKDSSTRDAYGRWLGFVFLHDGTFINLELVKGGFAFNYPFSPDTSKADQFQAAEKTARGAAAGLWANCTVHQTKYGREQTNTL